MEMAFHKRKRRATVSSPPKTSYFAKIECPGHIPFEKFAPY